jgi:ubiquinone/menaquinone biosynthesis C-methylase UbiE
MLIIVGELTDMNNRVFNGPVDRLRSKERLEILEVEKVIKLCLEGEKELSVLDVGTGTGIFAEAFEKSGCKVTGIDTNSEFLSAAKKFAPQTDFRIGKAEKLDFENNAFSLIFMGHVLHEVDDLKVTLAEAYRVCRKKLAILEWPKKEQEMGPPISHRLDFVEVKKAATSAGFRSEKEIELDKLVLWVFEK